jgi:dynein intermediate chain 1
MPPPLSEADLDAEMPPRVLACVDPRRAANNTVFAWKDLQYQQKSDSNPLIVHFNRTPSLIPADPVVLLAEQEWPIAPGPTQIFNPKRDQFQFIDRWSQTPNPKVEACGFSTKPPASCDYEGTVSKSIITDAYVSKPNQTSSPVSAWELLYSEGMRSAIKLMERMVTSNLEAEAFTDLKFYVDGADAFRTSGAVLPLWRFVCDKVKKKEVTCVRWNLEYPDLFAASYGTFDFMKQGSGGGVVVYSLKNPRTPEYFVVTDGTVCSIDWNRTRPALLAVGLYDGSVAVIDVRSKDRKLIFKTSIRENQHLDAVWEVRWITEDTFVSVSSDGRVAAWTLRRSKLRSEELSELHPEPNQDDEFNSLMDGLCMDFNPLNDEMYLVGTQDGAIIQFSRIIPSRVPIAVYKGHSMAVYAVKWNPFNPEVFLSCSADGNICLWLTSRTTAPLRSFDLWTSVGDVEWSPVCATAFACVTSEGFLVMFDLEQNRLKAVSQQKIVAKGKLNRLAHNRTQPLMIIGDDRGGVSCAKLSPNLAKALPDNGLKNLNHIVEVLLINNF